MMFCRIYFKGKNFHEWLLIHKIRENFPLIKTHYMLNYPHKTKYIISQLAPYETKYYTYVHICMRTVTYIDIKSQLITSLHNNKS